MSEIVATRAIAPFVGITLETISAVIGCVLAGISAGSWAGGWLSDRVPVRHLILVSLTVGGLGLMAAPSILNSLGPTVQPSDPSSALLLSAAAFLLPSVVLSAVPPAVLKSLGQDSPRLGSVAGLLSAIGTAGALLGNFGAGFVLVGQFGSSQILVACGLASLAIAALFLAVGAGQDRLTTRGSAAILLFAAAVALSIRLSDALPCDAETKYVCLNITEIATERYLIESNIYSSSVTDVANPQNLQFDYVRAVAGVVEEWRQLAAPQRPLSIGYVGGGGYTLPLYFETIYPGSGHVVYEIDAELVDAVAVALRVPDLEDRFPTEVGDARAEIRTAPDNAYDVVVGDAFSGISVPWHLTTAEFLREVQRSLKPDGIYIMNLIDYDGHDLARAEAASFAQVFDDVAVIGPSSVVLGRSDAGSNVLLLGSSELPGTESLNDALRASGSLDVAIGGPELVAFMSNADVLTDELAPVDQLLGRP